MAQNNPSINFVGVEVHLPGVGRLVNEAGKQELQNLKTYCADAVDVLTHCLPEKSLDRVQLFFPDPWHKKRHHKRRIVQDQFVSLVCERLKMGGVFHLATDWQPYAEHMLMVLSAEARLKNVAGEQQYSERPGYRPITKFEKRGVNLGHGVWDLLFCKQEN